MKFKFNDKMFMKIFGPFYTYHGDNILEENKPKAYVLSTAVRNNTSVIKPISENLPPHISNSFNLFIKELKINYDFEGSFGRSVGVEINLDIARDFYKKFTEHEYNLNNSDEASAVYLMINSCFHRYGDLKETLEEYYPDKELFNIFLRAVVKSRAAVNVRGLVDSSNAQTLKLWTKDVLKNESPDFFKKSLKDIVKITSESFFSGHQSINGLKILTTFLFDIVKKNKGSNEDYLIAIKLSEGLIQKYGAFKVTETLNKLKVLHKVVAPTKELDDYADYLGDPEMTKLFSFNKEKLSLKFNLTKKECAKAEEGLVKAWVMGFPKLNDSIKTLSEIIFSSEGSMTQESFSFKIRYGEGVTKEALDYVDEVVAKTFKIVDKISKESLLKWDTSYFMTVVYTIEAEKRKLELESVVNAKEIADSDNSNENFSNYKM